MIRIPLVLGALLIGVLSSGCANMALMFTPDMKPAVPAEFKLPAGKTAVLIDDYMISSTDAATREAIAQRTMQLLQENGAVRRDNAIDYSQVESLKKQGADGRLYSIQQLGRETGADLVIYVNLTQFDLQADPESPLILPAGRAQVKVMDVGTGERLWPIDIAGRSVQVRGRREGDMLEPEKRQEWTDQLADMLGAEVARLFYAYREE
ncbi:MAG: hypothetical protein GXY33_14540 [Phycisphaerae bacterium]|nr:hypothetical protein [Phycisphaerae bacterium]